MNICALELQRDLHSRGRTLLLLTCFWFLRLFTFLHNLRKCRSRNRDGDSAMMAGVSHSPLKLRTGQQTGFSRRSESLPIGTLGIADTMSSSWTRSFLFVQRAFSSSVASSMSRTQI